MSNRNGSLSTCAAHKIATEKNVIELKNSPKQVKSLVFGWKLQLGTSLTALLISPMCDIWAYLVPLDLRVSEWKRIFTLSHVSCNVNGNRLLKVRCVQIFKRKSQHFSATNRNAVKTFWNLMCCCCCCFCYFSHSVGLKKCLCCCYYFVIRILLFVGFGCLLLSKLFIRSLVFVFFLVRCICYARYTSTHAMHQYNGEKKRSDLYA